MPTLLLRCVAPLQSWGTQSQFSVRDTGREPSKSGIVGLLCAALGVPRDDTEMIGRLAKLPMGVRVDQEGEIIRDYHTAGMGGYVNASGTVERKKLITSERYYLADAAFLVGLESPQREIILLQQLHEALRDPYWMLFLGRKACPPGEPVYLRDGVQPTGLEAALAGYPWLGRQSKVYKRLPDSVRLVLDDPRGSEQRHDLPISFARDKRSFTYRLVRTTLIPKPPFAHPDEVSL